MNHQAGMIDQDDPVAAVVRAGVEKLIKRRSRAAGRVIRRARAWQRLRRAPPWFAPGGACLLVVSVHPDFPDRGRLGDAH
jgi:hypothetical protein